MPETMPWANYGASYGSLEDGEDDEPCHKDTPDQDWADAISTIVVIITGFCTFLIGVAILSMILVILVDAKYL